MLLWGIDKCYVEMLKYVLEFLEWGNYFNELIKMKYIWGNIRDFWFRNIKESILDNSRISIIWNNEEYWELKFYVMREFRVWEGW